MTTIADFVGKRILCTTKSVGSFRGPIEEVKVLELSPSANYVRLMNEYGRKYWRPVTDVAVIETLVMPEPYPKS